MVDIFYVFGDLFYCELLVCYIQIIYIILKFDFVWISASVLDEIFVNNSGSCSPKCWKNYKFSNFNENSEEKLLNLEIYIWHARYEGNFENELQMRWSALRVPGGNQVDGLPPARHTEPRWIGVTLGPRRFMIMVDIFMFLVIFYIRSYWFVTFRSFISYWSLIFCEYQPPCSTEPLLTTGVTLRQNVEKMMKFSIFHENS